MKSRWQVRLAQQAKQDYSAILTWTVGARQARTYDATSRSALKALAEGPDGCRTRDEIGPGLLSLHVARKGRKGRHFILL